jgi:hypothetical protein
LKYRHRAALESVAPAALQRDKIRAIEATETLSMDTVEKLEQEHPDLNWVDWMDVLLQESFEKSARAWAGRRTGMVGGIAPAERRDDSDEVAEAA